LLNAKNAIEGLSKGAADFASVVAVYEPGKLVSLEVVDVPQYHDEWISMRAAHEFLTTNAAALKDFGDRGLHYVSHFTTGPTQLITNKPVRTAADLKGMKIRATGNFVTAFNTLGAATVSMSQPDVYQALSSGAIDASASYYYVVKAYKQYEIADYLSELNLGQSLGWGIVMNKRTYDSLSDDDKAMVDKLGSDFVDHMAGLMYQSRVKTREELTKGIDGHTVSLVEPEASLRQALIAAAESKGMEWVDKAKAKGMPGKQMLGEFRGLLKTWEDRQKAEGYPWDRQ